MLLVVILSIAIYIVISYHENLEKDQQERERQAKIALLIEEAANDILINKDNNDNKDITEEDPDKCFENVTNMENMTKVDNIISETIKSDKYQQGNKEERVGILVILMEELVKKGIIKDYEVEGKSEPHVIYYYNCGVSCVILTTEFREDQN